MPSQYCFLCASDEGVFLDITADNKKQYHEQFEICSLVTVPTANKLPTKICHKCAYELKQCSSFVKKYKRCTSVQKKHNRSRCCNLCFESTEKEYIFNLSKEKNSEHNLLSKIQKLFDNEQEKSEGDRILICLSCRYTVDVLFDLKNISQKIATKLDDIVKKGIDYANFPKIKTAVVSRKTTVTDSARTTLYTLQDIDTIMRTRSQKHESNDNNSNEKSKLQVCEKCHSSVNDNDADIHKVKNTGQIVCKSCWVDTGLETNKIDKQLSLAETKSCKVFLKDVLRDKTENQRKLYEVKEDGQGKKTYVVTDKTSEDIKKEVEASSKVVNDVEIMTVKQGVKRSLRHMKTDNTDNKESLNKKIKLNTKQVNSDSKLTSSVEEPIARKLRLRVHKSKMKNASRSSESDSSVSKSVNERKNTLTRHKRATGSSLSDADVDSKRDRKKLKSILAGNTVIKNLNVTLSVDGDTSKRKKLRFTSASPVMIDLTNKNVTQEVSRRRTAMRSLKLPSTQEPSKNSTDFDSVIEISSDDNNETYACEECGSNYENKLVYMSHKLTHYKQPKLKLEKMVIKNLVKDTPDVREAVDDECIQIRVDDDEDDEVVDVVNNLDASPVTKDRPPSSTEERIENAVDVESITKDPDDDRDQQSENEVKKLEDQKAVETSLTNSPSKVRSSPRRGRPLNQQNQDEQTNRRGNNVSLSFSESKKKDNTSAEENVDTSLEQTKDAEVEKHRDSSSPFLSLSFSFQLTQTENDEADKNQNNTDSPTENASAKNNEDGSLTQIENEKTEENEDVSHETTEDPKTEDVQDKENKEENNESRIGEEITDVEEDKEKQKKSEDVGGKEEIVCTQQDSETIDKESETIDKENESNDKENESNDKENESNDKENESNDKENENNDKESKTSDKENETNDKESETSDKENETNVKESETINKENETNGNDNSIELDSTKEVEDIADEEEVDSSKTIERKKIEEELTDADVGIIDGSRSENAANKKASNSTEKIEVGDEDEDDEAQCTQKDVVSISNENNTGNNDGEIVEKDLTETSTAIPRKSKNDSTDAAVEVLQEVLDLANAEVQKRQELVNVTIEQDSTEMETLENISREISNGGEALKENSAIVSL